MDYIPINNKMIAKICILLSLPVESYLEYWRVIDQDGNIMLLHYNQDNINKLFKSNLSSTQIEQILSLSGTIVDPVNSWICCKSYGFTNSIISDHINDSIQGVDYFGNQINIPIEGGTFQPCYNGPIIRIWKYKGQTYLSTPKKIDASNVKWGKSENFKTIFLKLFSELNLTFSEASNLIFGSEETSNIAHVFIMAYPDLTSNSKLELGAGYLLYIKKIACNPIDLQNVNIEWISEWSATTKLITFLPENCFGKEDVPIPIPSEIAGKYIYHPTNINVNVANMILSRGFKRYESSLDKRLTTGEYVIFIHHEKIIQIQSTASAWREKILRHNPNYYQNFVSLLEYSKEAKKEEYNELFYNFNPPERPIKELYLNSLSSVPQIFSSPEREAPHEIVSKKIRNIALNFMFAVPHHMMDCASEYYNIFFKDREMVITYFITNFEMLKEEFQISNTSKTFNFLNNSIKRILNQSINYIDNRKKDGTNFNKITKEEFKDSTLRNQNIRFLFFKEDCNSMYKFIIFVASRLAAERKKEVEFYEDQLAVVPTQA